MSRFNRRGDQTDTRFGAGIPEPDMHPAQQSAASEQQNGYDDFFTASGNMGGGSDGNRAGVQNFGSELGEDEWGRMLMDDDGHDFDSEWSFGAAGTVGSEVSRETSRGSEPYPAPAPEQERFRRHREPEHTSEPEWAREPSRTRESDEFRPHRREPENTREPEWAREPSHVREPYAEDRYSFDAKPENKKKGKAVGVVFAVLLLLLGAAAAYAWFSPDIYYVTSVELEQNSAQLFVGENISLISDISALGTDSPAVEWISSAPEVVSVSAEGGVSALAEGTAQITLRETKSQKEAVCSVTVKNVEDMYLSFTEITAGVGESTALTVQTVGAEDALPEFASSDNAVAAVDENGTVTAVGAGSAQITVSVRGHNDAYCSVEVKAAPTAVEAVTDGKLCLGEVRQITVSMSDAEHSSSMKYESSDPAVVSVDSNGVMTAQEKGSASVTVTAHNGVSCSLEVSVGSAPSSVTVSKSLTVYNGRPLVLEVSDNTGRCRQYTYTSADPDVVEVDEDGTLHMRSPGSTTVTCTSYNGKSASCKVTSKIVDYQNPYTSDIVYENIAALAAAYPDIISTESIGTSVQGRDITLVKLGKGERKVLVVAGMHSKEHIAVTFTMRTIEEYAEAYTKGKKYGGYKVTSLLDEYTIYYVPLMNPDGMDIFMGVASRSYTDEPLVGEDIAAYKNNANGVNLNRNFPFEWGAKKVNVTTPDVNSYAGASAGSEPETQAIISLCAANEFEWLMDMHCRGHLVYYQDKVNAETKQAENMARRLYKKCDFTLTDKSTVYEISGGLENWFRSEYGRAGLCVELVPSLFNTNVNESFERKTKWEDTKYIFLMCLGL